MALLVRQPAAGIGQGFLAESPISVYSCAEMSPCPTGGAPWRNQYAIYSFERPGIAMGWSSGSDWRIGDGGAHPHRGPWPSTGTTAPLRHPRRPNRNRHRQHYRSRDDRVGRWTHHRRRPQRHRSGRRLADRRCGLDCVSRTDRRSIHAWASDVAAGFSAAITVRVWRAGGSSGW